MEKAFLVGTHIKKKRESSQETQDSMEELARLSETAGAQVVGRTTQYLEHPDPATYIGKGKVEELSKRAEKNEFSMLVFDDELKPAQHKNLSEKIPVKILDRTRIILDIFAKRAKTREGILQVELAQLSYHLPRMTERYGKFEQQVGGIGTRGPGERKLEVEARHIRDRVASLKKQIESIKLHREIARERRQKVPLPTIAIVGYTNAGKSTLINSLIQFSGEDQEKVYADDKLFATLDPTTRRVKLPSGRWALFTDTVGFIKKLPTHLIAAFRSTLEETLNADLLIHLIDANDKNKQENEQTVIQILESLQSEQKYFWNRMLVVYNKIDQLEEITLNKITEPYILLDQDRNEHRITPLKISAKQGKGLSLLLQSIENILSLQMIKTKVHLSFDQMYLLPSLYRLGQVESVEHKNKGMTLHLKLEKSHFEKLQRLIKKTIKE